MNSYSETTGIEMFPEFTNSAQNSYQDVQQDQFVDDPLNQGVKQTFEDATQENKVSDKEYNFRALREEAAKMKEEREYWKGQAEALSKVPARQPEPEPIKNPYETIDWDDGRDVRKAFDALREENQRMKHEFQDALTAVSTKAQYSDWNEKVTQHLPELTNKNPIFAEMIKKSSNPYEAAYLLAQLNASKTGVDVYPPQVETSGNAQRAIANSMKPQTLASTGGRGSLSQADYYAQMSDEDFQKIASRNLANT